MKTKKKLKAINKNKTSASLSKIPLTDLTDSLDFALWYEQIQEVTTALEASDDDSPICRQRIVMYIKQSLKGPRVSALIKASEGANDLYQIINHIINVMNVSQNIFNDLKHPLSSLRRVSSNV